MLIINNISYGYTIIQHDVLPRQETDIDWLHKNNECHISSWMMSLLERLHMNDFMMHVAFMIHVYVCLFICHMLAGSTPNNPKL